MEDFTDYASRWGLDAQVAAVFQRYAELWEQWQSEKNEEQRIEHARAMSQQRR